MLTIKWLLGWLASPFVKFGMIILAVLGAIGSVYVKGRLEGGSAERQKQLEQTVKRGRTRNAVEEKNRSAKPDPKRSRLRKYARD
jgi:hypothetical protein